MMKRFCCAALFGLLAALPIAGDTDTPETRSDEVIVTAARAELRPFEAAYINRYHHRRRHPKPPAQPDFA